MDICTPRFWQLHLVPDLKSFLEFSSSSDAFLDICNNAESEYWIKQMIFNCRHWCVCVFFFFFPRPQEHPLLHDRWHQLLSSSKCLRLKPQCNPRQRYSVPRLCKWVCRELMSASACQAHRKCSVQGRNVFWISLSKTSAGLSVYFGCTGVIFLYVHCHYFILHLYISI